MKNILPLGQQDDARMNLAVVLTAARHGAACANHVRVTSLMKDANGKLCGAKVKVREQKLSVILASF